MKRVVRYGLRSIRLPKCQAPALRSLGGCRSFRLTRFECLGHPTSIFHSNPLDRKQISKLLQIRCQSVILDYKSIYTMKRFMSNHHRCLDCNASISEKVHSFSTLTLGLSLCIPCQNRLNEKSTNATPEARALYIALRKRNVPAELEKYGWL